MTIVSNKLKTRIASRLANNPTGINCCILENADILLNESILSVSSTSNLPSASQNTGRLFYVEDISSYLFSNGFDWISEFDTSLNAQLFSWGSNVCGRLGDGSTTDRSSPGTTAGGGADWCQVSAGGHTAAVKTNGTLWTWGCNIAGQLGYGTTNRSSPGTTEGGGADWCQVSAGGHTAAVKTNGTLWTWGCNTCGQLGDGSTTSRLSPVTPAGGGTDWCQVSAGNRQTAAVKQDGTLWTWGCNAQGQLGTGNTTNRTSPGTTAGGGTNWCQASAGRYHTAAVKQDGTLWTWGSNPDGRLGDGSTTSRSSPGTTAGGGTDWSQVSAGCIHTAAVKTNGTLWTWGNNGSGQLGAGSTTSRSSPGTTAGGGTDWCQVSAGDAHTAAVKTNGTLWTWGCNTCGQLGNGSTTNRSSPGTTAGGGINWFQVSAGSQHTVAIAVIRPSFPQQSII
jgi:alpha-tubulin suppressor-like RCC1 family protein